MKCYAFRSRFVEEGYLDHVIGVVQCVESRWEFEGLKRKLERLYHVDKSVTNDFILLAAIIHDIGKVDVEFQSRCVDECSSFPYHYELSARLALRLGYEVDELSLSTDNISKKLEKILSHKDFKPDLGELYLALVVLPILLHHYAQIVSEWSVIRGSTRYKNMERVINISIHNNCVDEIVPAVKLKSEIGKKLLNKLKDIIDNEGKSVNLSIIPEDILRKSMSYQYITGRIIVEAAIGILNLCDGLIAHSKRSPSIKTQNK